MDDLIPASLVHFYDTRIRRIACGVSGYDHRSTKHARQVTCQACVALLGQHRSQAAESAAEASAAAH
jgi:hypothetical protein